MKIEGGVYDGRQLVLAWPDTYRLPPALPKIGGTGGNESNAGSDNNADSTEEGQRPHLPQEPDPATDAEMPASPDAPENSDTSGPPGAPESPDASVRPNTPENQDAPGRFSALSQTPPPPDASSAEKDTRQEQSGEHTSGTDMQRPAAVQISADTNAEAQYPTDTDSISFDTKENTQHNTGTGVYGFLLAAAAAGICIITVFGKTAAHKILNALRRLLPQK